MDGSDTTFDMDIIGVLEGTDKSSSVRFAWDYLRHYQTLFEPWRDQPINLIEIGVEEGPSLNVWRKYFSCARIVGIDINPNCRHLAGDRVVIEIGSQEDPGFLHQICAKYPPSIIIDDGSHMAHHVVYSFRHMFPMLQAGGLYVVEDLEGHFDKGEPWAGNKSVSVPEYFLKLAHQRMANNHALEATWGDDRYIRDHTDTMTFIGGAVVVRKRKPRDVAPALAFVDQYLQSADKTPTQLLRLVEYILRHGGPLEHAERVVRDAASLGGPSPQTYGWRVEILCRQGRVPEAADVAAEATRLWPDNHGTWNWLSHVEQRLGHVTAAIATLERAMSMHPNEVHYHDRLGHLLQQQGEPARALMAAKKAASLHPTNEPLQQRVTDLERLTAAVSG